MNRKTGIIQSVETDGNIQTGQVSDDSDGSKLYDFVNQIGHEFKEEDAVSYILANTPIQMAVDLQPI